MSSSSFTEILGVGVKAFKFIGISRNANILYPDASSLVDVDAPGRSGNQGCHLVSSGHRFSNVDARSIPSNQGYYLVPSGHRSCNLDAPGNGIPGTQHLGRNIFRGEVT